MYFCNFDTLIKYLDELADRYKVISFDCWATLINLNALMWSDMANFIKEEFGLEMPLDEIIRTSRRSDSCVNQVSVNNEKEYGQDYRIKALLYSLKVNYSDMQINKVKNHLDYLLMKRSSAEIIDIDIKNKLAYLGQSSHLIILSNTGMISGKQTKDLLKRMGLHDLFYRVYMSDEIGYLKPSQKIFNFVANDLKKDKVITKTSDIFHIGDNYKLDCLAAKRSYFDSAHIDWDNLRKRVSSMVKFFYSQDYKLYSTNHQLLSPDVYSNFKYGIKSHTEYACKILFGYLDNFKDLLYTEKPLVFVKLSQGMSSADSILRNTIYSLINKKRHSRGFKRCESIYISRKTLNLKSNSYLTACERNGFSTDDFIIYGVNNIKCPAIFIDDIIVSGSLSTSVYKFLTKIGYRDVYMFFLARCEENSLIRERSIEKDLNNFSVKSLSDFNSLISTYQNYFIPTRKYYKLLVESNDKDIIDHINLLTPDIKEEICNTFNNPDLILNTRQRRNAEFIIKVLNGYKYDT